MGRAWIVRSRVGLASSLMGLALSMAAVAVALSSPGMSFAESAASPPGPATSAEASTIPPTAERTLRPTPTLWPTPTPERTRGLPALVPTTAPSTARTLEPTPTPSPTPTFAPSSAPNDARVVSEVRVMTGIEPSLAASPFQEGLLALVAQSVDWKTMCGYPQFAVSEDSARHWRPIRSPWGDRCVDIHAVLAWGPGPGEHSSRLWAADAIPARGGLALSIAHSDDLGRTWSRPAVETFTPGWVGCYPIIAVDNRPGSPNFGTLFAAYNWMPKRAPGAGPGGTAMSVIATRDGTTWSHTNVGPIGLEGVPYSWTFGPRLAFGRDGSVYLSFYEQDLHDWSPSQMFHENWPGNIVRAGFVTARLSLDRGPGAGADSGPAGSTGSRLTLEHEDWAMSVEPSDLAALNPEAQSSLAMDEAGRLWLAVNATSSAGYVVRLGMSENGGRSWSLHDFAVPGERSVKPSLVIAGDQMLLAWHSIDSRGRLWARFSLSRDRGATFPPPQLASRASYRLPGEFNDTGLRENADWADGRFYWAWGDNRSGVAAYVATIEP